MEIEPERLPIDPKTFWKNSRIPKIPVLEPHQSSNAKPPILQRLGSFPYWRGEKDFFRTLLRIYDAVRSVESSRR